MVQDMDLANYNGRPQEPPGYTKHAAAHKPLNIIPRNNEVAADTLREIFILLRSATDHDFSLYKKNTICRRIERRMHVHQISNIDNYLYYLKKSDREVSILFKELLIGVTNFFRDHEAFETLKNNYLPKLLKNKPKDYTIRVWVPGCSSGEETYSIAIVLQECMDAMGRHFNIQIFGTDIDEEALYNARKGFFPESIAANIIPEHLQKYFIKRENYYQIKKLIREMVVFAPQNIIKDPPFAKLDFLSCRNLLIYFKPELQEKLLPIFHYSLKPGALLFLGSSETIGQQTDLFSLQEKKWKIFRRKPAVTPRHSVFAVPPPLPGLETTPKEPLGPYRKIQKIDTLQLVKYILAQSGFPPCVVIDDQADILYIHGRVSNYLELSEGEISINILRMARPGLKVPLSTAIRKMVNGRQETVVNNIQVKNNEGCTTVNLVIRPMPNLLSCSYGIALVIFEKSFPAGGKMADRPEPLRQKKKKIEVKNLEEELQYTRESLQSTIEELETSNEALQSTNEELQSINEELQSKNEELETSKEELQSLNEESITINAELQSGIEELSNTNDDMKNLLNSTDIAIIFLDKDLSIRRFTSQATELIHLTLVDIGRPITHLTNELKEVDLYACLKKVLDDLVVRKIMVESRRGSFYTMHIRPLRTVNNVVDGLVITFVDITKTRKLYQEAKRLAAVVKDSNDAITLLDFEGNILAWNNGALKLYGYSENEALKMNISKIIPLKKQQDYRALIIRLKDEDVEPFVTARQTKEGATVHVWLSLTRLLDDEGKAEFITTTERDVSQLTAEAMRMLTGGDHARE